MYDVKYSHGPIESNENWFRSILLRWKLGPFSYYPHV